jgi:general secretion pathway protein M
MRALNKILDAWNDMDRPNRLRWGYGLVAILTLAVAFSLIYDRISLLESKRQRREADLVEMLRLKGSYQEARNASLRLANKLAAVRSDDSPAKLIEETGIRGKSLRITPLKTEQKNGFTEEAADIKIDGLTANEAVNLLHRIEKGQRQTLIRKALMRTRFDDPSKLDLTITVSLLRGSPQGVR